MHRKTSDNAKEHAHWSKKKKKHGFITLDTLCIGFRFHSVESILPVFVKTE